MEGHATRPSSSQEASFAADGDIAMLPSEQAKSSTPSSPRSKRVDKRTRRAGPPPSAHLVPLPTIETIMTYPSLPRPLYDSLARGEPPAQSYNTVIHTPKPPNMRTLDQNLLRAAEMSAIRRKNKGRSRSNTGSSTVSSASGSSASASSTAADDYSSSSDISEPTSPASTSSSTKATVASGSSTADHFSFPPAPESPSFNPNFQFPLPSACSTSSSWSSSTEDSIIASYSTPSSHTRDPSPSQSFHSTLSTLCGSASSLSAPGAFPTSSSSTSTPSSSLSRSSAPSPASSAYPSPPASPSPESSRRTSSSGEEFMYPSPPPSPGFMQAPITLAGQGRVRARRAFTYPPAPSPPLLNPQLLQVHGTIGGSSGTSRGGRMRSASLTSHPPSTYRSIAFGLSVDLDPLPEAEEFDLGGQQLLGGGPLYEDADDDDMDWSLNGGRIVFGAAGVACSPRAMRGCCGECEVQGEGGLGLYVIEEEGERDVDECEGGGQDCSFSGTYVVDGSGGVR